MVTVERGHDVREITLSEPATVQQGDRIRTSTGGRGLLVLSPSASAVLDSGSEVLLGELRHREGGYYDMRLEVMGGEIVHRLSTWSTEVSRYEILTPAASVLPSAGQCLVRVSGDGETVVEVREGMAKVSARDTTVEVWPGEYTSIAQGRAPSVARAIVARFLLVSERTGNAEIWLLDEEDRDFQLTHQAASDLAPVWSPDGTRVAFESWRDGNSEIYVMDGDGSNQLNLTGNPADDYAPMWSPDGQFIAFESLRDGQREVYVMRADGAEPTRLTFGPGLSGAPYWEVGGSEIIFSRVESDTNGDGVVDLRDLAAFYSVPQGGGTSYAFWYTRLVYDEMVFPWVRRAIS
ncbi:MAG TPA: FecR domain-containing protein [Anaerolineae bacterium]|nr:FecR domain-containing protein [Anaerolineae bacterium]